MLEIATDRSTLECDVGVKNSGGWLVQEAFQ